MKIWVLLRRTKSKRFESEFSKYINKSVVRTAVALKTNRAKFIFSLLYA